MENTVMKDVVLEQKEFYRAMKAHCQSMNAECENCCMRLYCYTPPCNMTDFMVDKIISFLSTEHSCSGYELQKRLESSEVSE